ncbi:MAG: AsmA-like C-terminal region-containing protein [Gemmataceae bacterium]|nr:AsmA-like C-terminal region-containing protein [Gemmataceae bacterium]
MAWRTWLVRVVVFCVLGAIAAAAFLFFLYTDPARVRLLVQEKLGVRFNHVSVGLHSARLRLLGGILVRDLRLSRNDSLDHGDFLHVPSAVIMHDKEHLLEGRMLVRRLEMDRPQVRIVRGRDGRVNLQGILAPSAGSDERMPTLVVRGGTVSYEDQQLAPGVTLLEVRDVDLTLVNDPLPVLEIEAAGTSDVLGPVRFKATLPRDTWAATARLDLPEIPVGAALVHRLSVAVPEAGRLLAGLSARARLGADITTHSGQPEPVRVRASFALEDGTLSHPSLPGKLEGIELAARCEGRTVPEATLKARMGEAELSARVAGLPLPGTRAEAEALPEAMRELEASAKHVPVDAAFLARLPDKLAFLRADYSPSGPAAFSYSFKRLPDGKPSRVLRVRPEGMKGEYAGFRYGLEGLVGELAADLSDPLRHEVALDLTAYSGELPVRIRGRVSGDRAAPGVAIDIGGDGVPLDQRLYDALSPKAQRIASRFLPERSRALGLAAHPMGKADVRAEIRRAAGTRRYSNTVRAAFKDVEALYDEFPLALSGVSGQFVLHPDHWEAKGFKGKHDGGTITVDGGSTPLPDQPGVASGDAGPPERVSLSITGTDIRLDNDFARALVPAEGAASAQGPVDRKSLQKVWQGLALAGVFRFAALVVLEPNKPLDARFSLGFDDCTMKPGFFPLAMQEVRGKVGYAKGKVSIEGFSARHDQTRVALASGVVQPRPDGGLGVWLEGLEMRGARPDQALLRALPEGLRRGLETVRLGPAFDAGAESVTLEVPAGGTAKAWWKGGVAFQDATLRAGTEVEKATGRFHCEGHFDGQKLHSATGQLALASATVLGQPLTGLTARLEAEPRSPGVLRVRDLKAGLFGGTVGGEASVSVSPSLRYDVVLDAVGIRLEQFARHNMGERTARKAELSGPVRAALHLQGEGDDLLGLKGSGRVDIADGKMGQLPAMLDLFKALGLRKPDGTAFEQAHLEFGIEGTRLAVQVLDLKGQAISLRGSGSLLLDGSNVEIDFAATPGLLGWLPPALESIPNLFSKQLLKIKMRGRLGRDAQVRFDKELVPAFTGRLRGLMGRE